MQLKHPTNVAAPVTPLLPFRARFLKHLETHNRIPGMDGLLCSIELFRVREQLTLLDPWYPRSMSVAPAVRICIHGRLLAIQRLKPALATLERQVAILIVIFAGLSYDEPHVRIVRESCAGGRESGDTRRRS